MRTILQEVRFVLPVTIALASCAHGQRAAETPSAPAVERARPAEVRVPEGWTRYVVRRGDTLGRIARCRGASLDALARVNGIDDPDRLAAGARLHVPARDRCARRTTVARQETAPRAVAPGPAPKGVAKDVVTAAPSPKPGAASRAPSVAAAPPALDAAQATLDAAAARYDAADFEGAIAGAEAASAALESVPRDPASDALRARCHALVAMAALGLEQRERALAELRIAFGLDPGLAFDPATTSPRVVELAKEARSSGAAPTAR